MFQAAIAPLVLVALVALATPASAVIVTVDFTSLGTFTTPELATGGVIVTGSDDVNVFDGAGIGIVGGTSDTLVDVGEFISFSFAAPSVTDVEVFTKTVVTSSGTGNAAFEAFAPGGASLGSQTLDIFAAPPFIDVSALFGDVPLESLTITPLDTTRVRIGEISFMPVPEPSTALLLAAGFAALGFDRSRRNAGAARVPRFERE